MKKLGKSKALLQLKELITQIPKFKSYGSDQHPDFYNWRKRVVSLLIRQLGADSKEVADFSAIDFGASLGDRLYNLDVSTNFLNGLKTANTILVEISGKWNHIACEQKERTKKKLRLLMNPWTITIVGGLIVAFLCWLFGISERGEQTTKNAKTQKQSINAPINIKGNNNTIRLGQTSN